MSHRKSKGGVCRSSPIKLHLKFLTSYDTESNQATKTSILNCVITN